MTVSHRQPVQKPAITLRIIALSFPVLIVLQIIFLLGAVPETDSANLAQVAVGAVSLIAGAAFVQTNCLRISPK